jgi:beta-xylosidase
MMTSSIVSKVLRVAASVVLSAGAARAANPIITDKYTADPAAMVYKDTVYLYTGHDEAPPRRDGYVMKEWLCFSSTDMVNWTEHPVPLKVSDFAWAKADAWASQVIERNGEACLFWGNTACYWAKLKEDMTELDGPIQTIKLPNFTEAPWVHKHDGWYYLSYAYQFPEKTAYAMSKSIEGPWEFKGILNEIAGNCNTNHQAIIDFKGKSYFIYHNGGIPTQGGSFRRSVCIDYLYYNPDGTMKRVQITSEGVLPAK